MIDPADQYQIGEPVLYQDQGVITIVTGYLWYYSVNRPPQVMGYHLQCGCTVSKDQLRPVELATAYDTPKSRFMQ